MPAPAATSISIPSSATYSGLGDVAWFTFTLATSRLVDFVSDDTSVFAVIFDAAGTPLTALPAYGSGSLRQNLAAGTYYMALAASVSSVASSFIVNQYSVTSIGSLGLVATGYPGVTVSGAIHVRDDFLGSAGYLDLREPNVQVGISGVRWVGYIGAYASDSVLGDGTLDLGVEGI